MLQLVPIAAAGVITDSLGRDWDPKKHPRDRKGKFIHTFRRIRAFLTPDGTDAWATGEVVQVNNDGSIRMKVTHVADPENGHYIGQMVDVKTDSIENINEKASLTNPGVPYTGVFEKWDEGGMDDFFQKSGFSTDPTGDLGLAKTALTNFKAGKMGTATNRSRYQLALYMHSQSGEGKPNSNADYMQALEAMGADPADIDDTPDGLSGIKGFLETENAGRSPNQNEKDSIAWFNEEIPSQEGVVRTARLRDSDIKVNWHDDGSQSITYPNGTVQQHDKNKGSLLLAAWDAHEEEGTGPKASLDDLEGPPEGFEDEPEFKAQTSVGVTEMDDTPFSTEEKAAYSYYIGAGYDNINPDLRNGTPLSAHDADAVNNMDAVLERSVLKEDTTLYRGMGDNGANAAQFKAHIDAMEPGAEVPEAAYMSMTTDEMVAESFMSGKYKAMFVIKAKKGQNAVDLGALGWSIQGEDEVLGSRGNKLKILDKVETGDNSWRIFAELVQDDQNPDFEVDPLDEEKPVAHLPISDEVDEDYEVDIEPSGDVIEDVDYTDIDGDGIRDLGTAIGASNSEDAEAHSDAMYGIATSLETGAITPDEGHKQLTGIANDLYDESDENEGDTEGPLWKLGNQVADFANTLVGVSAGDDDEEEVDADSLILPDDVADDDGMDWLKLPPDDPADLEQPLTAPEDETPEDEEWTAKFTALKGGPPTQVELEALYKYQGTKHKKINRWLRGDTEGMTDGEIAEIEEIVTSLDGLMERSSLRDDTKAYRGLKAPNEGMTPEYQAFIDSLVVGAEVEDDGYMSTSRYKVTANAFSEPNPWAPQAQLDAPTVLFEINLPEGHQGLDVDGLVPGGPGESEILLPRGSKISITGVYKDEDNKYNITADLVPDEGFEDGEPEEAPTDIADLGGEEEGQGLEGPPGLDTGPSEGDAPEAQEGAVSPFQVLDDPGTSGDGYYATTDGSKLWGKYGAAGVMVRHVDEDGTERFLMVQRGPIVSTNKGKWQLPGGALNSNEDDYQGTARELNEELQSPEGWLDNLEMTGEVNFQHPSGWHYNNIAATSPEMFEPTVDGTETGDAKWFTKDEIAQLPLHPALAKNLDAIFGTFDAPAGGGEEHIPDTSGIPDASGWQKQGGQKGSNPGGMFIAPDGTLHYVKASKTPHHAKNEALAAALYHEAGIDAAEQNLVDTPWDKLGTESPVIPGAKMDLKSHLNDQEYLDKVYEGFAVDAWLANWDVAGLVFDNMVTDADGNPRRIDPGGALWFRAQGENKGGAFSDSVSELDTFHHMGTAGQLFGKITPEQEKASAQRVVDISPERIDELVDMMNFGEDDPMSIGSYYKPVDPEVMKARLKARRKFIADHYGLELPEEHNSDLPEWNPDETIGEPDDEEVVPTAATKGVGGPNDFYDDIDGVSKISTLPVDTRDFLKELIGDSKESDFDPDELRDELKKHAALLEDTYYETGDEKLLTASNLMGEIAEDLNDGVYGPAVEWKDIEGNEKPADTSPDFDLGATYEIEVDGDDIKLDWDESISDHLSAWPSIEIVDEEHSEAEPDVGYQGHSSYLLKGTGSDLQDFYDGLENKNAGDFFKEIQQVDPDEGPAEIANDPNAPDPWAPTPEPEPVVTDWKDMHDEQGEYRVMPDGSKIRIGMKVKSTTDGLEGTVHKFEKNNDGAVVLGTDNKKRGRKIKTLQVQGETPEPEPETQNVLPEIEPDGFYDVKAHPSVGDFSSLQLDELQTFLESYGHLAPEDPDTNYRQHVKDYLDEAYESGHDADPEELGEIFHEWKSHPDPHFQPGYSSAINVLADTLAPKGPVGSPSSPKPNVWDGNVHTHPAAGKLSKPEANALNGFLFEHQYDMVPGGDETYRSKIESLLNQLNEDDISTEDVGQQFYSWSNESGQSPAVQAALAELGGFFESDNGFDGFVNGHPGASKLTPHAQGLLQDFLDEHGNEQPNEADTYKGGIGDMLDDLETGTMTPDQVRDVFKDWMNGITNDDFKDTADALENIYWSMTPETPAVSQGHEALSAEIADVYDSEYQIGEQINKIQNNFADGKLTPSDAAQQVDEIIEEIKAEYGVSENDEDSQHDGVLNSLTELSDAYFALKDDNNTIAPEEPPLEEWEKELLGYNKDPSTIDVDSNSPEAVDENVIAFVGDALDGVLPVGFVMKFTPAGFEFRHEIDGDGTKTITLRDSSNGAIHGAWDTDQVTVPKLLEAFDVATEPDEPAGPDIPALESMRQDIPFKVNEVATKYNLGPFGAKQLRNIGFAMDDVAKAEPGSPEWTKGVDRVNFLFKKFLGADSLKVAPVKNKWDAWLNGEKQPDVTPNPDAPNDYPEGTKVTMSSGVVWTKQADGSWASDSSSMKITKTNKTGYNILQKKAQDQHGEPGANAPSLPEGFTQPPSDVVAMYKPSDEANDPYWVVHADGSAHWYYPEGGVDDSSLSEEGFENSVSFEKVWPPAERTSTGAAAGASVTYSGVNFTKNADGSWTSEAGNSFAKDGVLGKQLDELAGDPVTPASDLPKLPPGHAPVPPDAKSVYKRVTAGQTRYLIEYADGTMHWHNKNEPPKMSTLPKAHADNYGNWTKVWSADAPAASSLLPDDFEQPPEGSTVLAEYIGDKTIAIYAVQHPDGELYYYYSKNNSNIQEKVYKPGLAVDAIKQYPTIWKLLDGGPTSSAAEASLPDGFSPLPDGAKVLMKLDGDDGPYAFLVQRADGELRIFHDDGDVSKAPSSLEAYKNSAMWKDVGTTQATLPAGYIQPPAGAKIGYVFEHEHTGIVYAVEHPDDGSWVYYYPDGKTHKSSINESYLVGNPEWTPYDEWSAPQPSTPAPAKTGPHMLGADNKPIYIGDKVQSTTDGSTGTVVKFESNGTGMVILGDDGKKRARKALKLKSLETNAQPVPQSAPVPTPTPTPPTPKPKPKLISKKHDPNPNSPWYNKEKPTPPALPPAEDVQYVDDAWMQKADANYKLRMKSKNANWTEKNLTESTTYGDYVAVQGGSMSKLDDLLKRGRITQELYDDAKAQIDKNAAPLLKKQAAYQAMYDGWLKDVKDWRIANGMPSIELRGMDSNVNKWSNSEAKAWMNQNQKPGTLGPGGALSAAAKQGVSSQKSSGQSGNYKHGLRALREKSLDENELMKLSNYKNIKNLEQAMDETAPVQEDFITIRTFSTDAFIDPDTGQPFSSHDTSSLSKAVGTIQHDWGFAETSPGSLEKGATSGLNVGGSNNIRMELRVPAGTRGIWTLHPSYHWGFTNERGFILERGVAYYIHSAEFKGGYWHVKAEIIPKDQVNYDEFGHFVNENPFFD